MIEEHKDIRWVTFFLAMVAGFCDTATFVAGKSIFSAHVTGNFILFAAQIGSENRNLASWARLLTFPVFVAAVIAGGWIANEFLRKHTILLIEGIFLLMAGALAILLPMIDGIDTEVVIYLTVIPIVIGMGLQNAYGKLFAGEILGPTTMMTGNVTQAALLLGKMIGKNKQMAEALWPELTKQAVAIGGFLAGCVAGAVLAMRMGLGVVLIPGLGITICYLRGKFR